jgi:teichuronic acid biosynthesis glycosyltransferase TuaG
MIESVKGQTLTDWEIILINDKSPLSLDPVKMKYSGDNRLRWLENSSNFGPAMTRNTAVALAESECILALDSDDMLASAEVLELMYDAWAVDQTKIIYGNLQMYTQIANNIFQRGKVIQLGEYTFELAMNLNGIMPVTAMHSKECHAEAGGWKAEMNAGLEDVEYWIAAGKRGYCGQKINYTTLIYRKQENSRAYKMSFVNRNFRAMQQKIKELHSDIYSGRFPMACCGKKGGSSNTPNDPAIISSQSKAQIITTLDGYAEKDLEWVAYRGLKQGSFGSILARGPAGTPSEYPILGKGHVFQIHKSHRKLFEDRQRMGFVMNEPDPRIKPEPEPMAPPVEVAPQVVEIPKPELSTVVQLDSVAARTREVEIRSPAIEGEVIIEPNLPSSEETSLNLEPIITDALDNAGYTVIASSSMIYQTTASLNLGPKITDILDRAGYTVEELARSTPQKLSSLPGIGIKRANTIIAKAQELIKQP